MPQCMRGLAAHLSSNCLCADPADLNACTQERTLSVLLSVTAIELLERTSPIQSCLVQVHQTH